MGPPGLQCCPHGWAGVGITAAPALQPRGTFWPGQLWGEPHPRGLSRFPTSVLLVPVMGHAQPHTWWCFSWQHHQTDPRQSSLPVMTQSKLALALRASLYSTALGNPVRAWRVIQPTEAPCNATPGSGSQVWFLPALQLKMCFLVSGLYQASGIRLVYEPAYIKSKQFITVDFPWSCRTVPLVPQLPAPWSSHLNPWLLGAVQHVVTLWVPLPPSALKAQLRSGILNLSS